MCFNNLVRINHLKTHRSRRQFVKNVILMHNLDYILRAGHGRRS